MAVGGHGDLAAREVEAGDDLADLFERERRAERVAEQPAGGQGLARGVPLDQFVQLGLVVGAWDRLTVLGAVIVLAQAAAVAVFADLQYARR